MHCARGRNRLRGVSIASEGQSGARRTNGGTFRIRITTTTRSRRRRTNGVLVHNGCTPSCPLLSPSRVLSLTCPSEHPPSQGASRPSNRLQTAQTSARVGTGADRARALSTALYREDLEPLLTTNPSPVAVNPPPTTVNSSPVAVQTSTRPTTRHTWTARPPATQEPSDGTIRGPCCKLGVGAPSLIEAD